jgi:hypothetical protein
MHGKRLWLAGAAMLVLLVGTVGVASAQGGNPDGSATGTHPVRAYGIVEAMDDAQFDLATPVRRVTIITDSSTVFRVRDGDAKGLAALEDGDTVGLTGWWEGDDVFHAFVVVEVVSDRDFPLSGELLAAREGRLEIDTRWGVAHVTVTDETVYRVPQANDPGPDDLEEGARVTVRGPLASDGTMTASAVIAQPLHSPGRWWLGKASGVGCRGLIVRTLRRRAPIRTGREPMLCVRGVDPTALENVTPCGLNAVRGVAKRQGPPTARIVVVLPDGAARLTGEVVGTKGTSVVIETEGGQVDVATDDGTSVHLPGDSDGSLGDLVPGVIIAATGLWEDAGTFRAVDIVVRRSRQPGAPAVMKGRLITVGEAELVVGTVRGPLTVAVSAGTRYSAPAIDDVGLSDLAAGDPVSARGTWTEDGVLDASHIRVLGNW